MQDSRPNVYRRVLGDARDDAGELLDDAGADRGNPLRAVTDAVTGAWTAPGSASRDGFLVDLHEAGARWRDALSRLERDAQETRAREPVEIDVDSRPDLRWKTEWGQFSVRSSGPA